MKHTFISELTNRTRELLDGVTADAALDQANAELSMQAFQHGIDAHGGIEKVKATVLNEITPPAPRTRDEIFLVLLEMRQRIETDCEEPLLDSDCALLYDVAHALDLTEYQSAILAGDVESDAPETEPAPAENHHDFSASGLGIGGAGSHQEPAIIPTVEQMKRQEAREQSALVCRKCGSSELDGAMFTNDAGSGLCDDCY